LAVQAGADSGAVKGPEGWVQESIECWGALKLKDEVSRAG